MEDPYWEYLEDDDKGWKRFDEPSILLLEEALSPTTDATRVVKISSLPSSDLPDVECAMVDLFSLTMMTTLSSNGSDVPTGIAGRSTMVRRSPSIPDELLNSIRTSFMDAQERKRLALLNAPCLPHSLDDVEVVVDKLNGSSQPKKVKWTKDDDEYFFVLKEGHGGNNDQCQSEYDVNCAYYAAGAVVPRVKIFTIDGRCKLLGTWVDGVNWKTFQERHGKTPEGRIQIEAVKTRLRQHFVLDCLFGNWDVLGASEDNVMVDAGGHPWRIDNGGCLSFRAQGEKKKPHEWCEVVSEINTMKYANDVTAKVFAGLSVGRMHSQIHELVCNEEKKSAILRCISTKEDRDILCSRFEWLQRWLSNQGYVPGSLGGSSEAYGSVVPHEEGVSSLIAMGFPREEAERALKKADNHLSVAIANLTGDDGKVTADAELVGQIAAMGFSIEAAQEALISKGNNLNAALDMLFG